MPRARVPGEEAATESRRRVRVSVSIVPFRGFGGPREKDGDLHGDTDTPCSSPERAGNQRVRTVEGAASAWVKLGGKKSMGRLREIEWL